MDLLGTAKKFSSYLHKRTSLFDIDDILLYGSLAKGEKNPRDIDIMVLHHNPVFEKIQRMRGKDGCADDRERVQLLSKELVKAQYSSLDGLLEIPECKEAIRKEILNVIYLHQKFFTDPHYRRRAITSNENPHFFRNVFNSGFIWNEKTKKFDIPITGGYAYFNEEFS